MTLVSSELTLSVSPSVGRDDPNGGIVGNVGTLGIVRGSEFTVELVKAEKAVLIKNVVPVSNIAVANSVVVNPIMSIYQIFP